MDTQHALMATHVAPIGPGPSEVPWLSGLLLISLAIHVGAVVSISKGHSDPRRKVKPPTLVTMTVASAAPPPSTAVPVATGSPTAQRVAAKRAAPKTAKTAKTVVAASPPSSPAPRAETPADFTGVTLTNDGPGAGWASATGNGGAMNGPIGTPGARVTGGSRAGATGGEGPSANADGPRVVGAGDLSKLPGAPVLTDMLEGNYPDEARRRGVPGRAVMRLRVMPDGHLRDLIVVAESGRGFGEACKRTLRDSLWSPPLDRQARPVSTIVNYTCTFAVH
jgi:outer membrane biosynthesis protein TonB